MQRKIVTVPQLERRTKESVKNVIIGLFVLVFFLLDANHVKRFL